MTVLIIVASVVILIAVYYINIYNRLIKNRNLVKEAWSSIDVILKERSNLVPNIVSTVKGYMQHEKQIFEDIAKYRAGCLQNNDIATQAKHENMLSKSLKQLFAVAENYPELKANQNFLSLQESLQTIEKQIEQARRYYNGTARDYNNVIESFPSNLVANTFHFQKRDYFELQNQTDRGLPQVSFN